MSRRSAVVVLALVGGCMPRSGRYVPGTRDVTVTTVPLLVKESRSLFPFLEADVAAGGVLAGKEVYGFVPSTITAGRVSFRLQRAESPADDVGPGGRAAGGWCG